MFIQCDTYHDKFKKLIRNSVDGVRYYKAGDSVYPSVTSVISFISRQKFAEWRARVGNEVANQITKQATTRGTYLHTLLESYLKNENYKDTDEWEKPLIQWMFLSAKTHLDKRMNNIHLQEVTMSSDRLKLAGTVDLVCEFDGELSVVDFKTSKKEKPEEWLEDYFVQLSAYWAMFAEATGVAPTKLVVFLIAENGDVQIVERRNPMYYLKILSDYVSQFAESRDASSRRG